MGAGESKGAAAAQAPAVDPNNLPVYGMEEVRTAQSGQSGPIG